MVKGGRFDLASGWIRNNLFSPFVARHARVFVGVDIAVAMFLTFIGVALLTIGDWGGAFLIIPTILMLWLAYVLFQGSPGES
jgi:hypothetical protein